MPTTLTAWLGYFVVAFALPAQPSLKITRHVIQDVMVVRVPVQPAPPRLVWEESKGPKCLPLDEIRGAAMSSMSSVDFIMRDRSRYRAQFEGDCPALDFYGDFYVESRDEDICAKREEIRSRMGERCTIRRFDRLRLTTAK